MSSSNSSPPSGSQSPSFWGVFNPTSKEFHEAEDAFHTLGWHQQLAVIAASILGGIILPIAGAFPAFCWVANWIKNGEDTKNPDQLDKIGSATKHTLPNNTTNLATENKSTSPEGAPGKTTQATDPAKNSTSFVKPSDAPLPEGTTSHVIHGHKPLSITFSEEIKKAHNIPSLYTQKCSEDVRFQPVLEFIKRFKFDPPIDYDHLTTFELLMTAIATASGHFLRSDGKWAIGDEPLIQVRTFKVLNDLLINLYQDKSLPELLRQEIKNDYLWRVRCLFEHFAGSFQDTPQSRNVECRLRYSSADRRKS
jgi:hypothetical protein